MPRSMPITNSTNWRASLNTGARPVRTLLNAFPNTCGIKPPLWPGCCPAVGWLSTCAYRPVISTNTWLHGPRRRQPHPVHPYPLSRCRAYPLAHRLQPPSRSTWSDPMAHGSTCAAPSPRHPWPPWCGPFWRARDDPAHPAKPYLFGHRTG